LATSKRRDAVTVHQDPRLVRVDDAWLRLPNPWGTPVEICAGPDVPIESAAVDEILNVLRTADTLERLGTACRTEADIDRVVLRRRPSNGMAVSAAPKATGWSRPRTLAAPAVVDGAGGDEVVPPARRRSASSRDTWS